MISVLSTEASTFRAFGWVQDPSNLRSLCNVVAVFDENSQVHNIVRNQIIPCLVEERDGRSDLLCAMDQRPLKIEYSKLVGTSFTPRSSSRCNGIIQATVKGQGRDFIGDWPADNFVRWAHAFGFIKYSYGFDTFEITPEGKKLVAARDSSVRYPQDARNEDLSKDEVGVLTEAILAYPPAVRILELLSATDNTHLTKFEIGSQLGFVGENGFTSLPQNILLRSLAMTEDAKECSKMRIDWDGSSDKYARMIAKWLAKLNLVEQVPKNFNINLGDEIKQESIGQAYRITAKGYTAIHKRSGLSKHKRIPKNVCFEMLATKGADREYLRTRRAYIIKCFVEAKKPLTVKDVQAYLEKQQMVIHTQTISDDIVGIRNIGIRIVEKNDGYVLEDEINDFIIPIAKQMVVTDQEQLKDELRQELKFISHEYLALIDLAYDSQQNRLFEMKTMQLLTEECGFEGLHLGGSRKPDGILYTMDLAENYGVIVDTKAYSKGYNLPISQADEMERYIGENQDRNPLVNPNRWWDNYDPAVRKFYFLFISGHFKGNFKAQLERVSLLRGINGAVLSVVRLLRVAELIKSKSISKEKLADIMFCNDEFIL